MTMQKQPMASLQLLMLGQQGECGELSVGITVRSFVALEYLSVERLIKQTCTTTSRKLEPQTPCRLRSNKVSTPMPSLELTTLAMSKLSVVTSHFVGHL